MWLLSFRSNQVWSVTWRYVQCCISEWPRGETRGGFMLQECCWAPRQSCLQWCSGSLMALQKACKYLTGWQLALWNVFSGSANMSIVFCWSMTTEVFFSEGTKMTSFSEVRTNERVLKYIYLTHPKGVVGGEKGVMWFCSWFIFKQMAFLLGRCFS